MVKLLTEHGAELVAQSPNDDKNVLQVVNQDQVMRYLVQVNDEKDENNSNNCDNEDNDDECTDDECNDDDNDDIGDDANIFKVKCPHYIFGWLYQRQTV